MIGLLLDDVLNQNPNDYNSSVFLSENSVK